MTSRLFLVHDTLNIECHAVVTIYMQVSNDEIHSKIRIQPYCSRYHIIQFIVETSKSLIEMPSTRKQKPREKRSRQSDALSDIENLDVMLGNYTNSEIREQEAVDQIEIDPESRRRQ